MLCYETEFTYRLKNGGNIESDEEKDAFEKKVRSVNKQLQAKWGENSYSIIVKADAKSFCAVTVTSEPEGYEAWRSLISENVSSLMEAEDISCTQFKEITVKEVNAAIDRCIDNSFTDLRRRCYSELNLDLDSRSYTLEERIIDGDAYDKAGAETEAVALMADPTLRDELDRIYGDDNMERFYGFPVHYHIRSRSMSSAMDIILLLVKALRYKKRLPAGRLSIVTSIERGCYDESGMENLFKGSAMSAVVFEMKGDGESEFASEYERVVKYISRQIKSYKEDTLFFLVENTGEKGFSGSFLTSLGDEMEIITINEGRGDKAEALEYLKRLVKDSRFAEFEDEDLYRILEDKNSFLASDVCRYFDKWKKKCLCEKVYASYKSYKKYAPEKKHKKKSAYKQLMGMTGLTEVKELTDQILAFYRLKKQRERYKIEERDISRHMVFTGNPGCAKTTVARLIAEVLTEEQILETGAFVECGRGDLVGRYVGWTAKTVISRFREAKGGVLFIDEAYSLVDDSHSFGDEAINTIVQQMENMRDQVIVIFAGYPGPMKSFIEKNEGLRSRIAFHMEFKDYNADELTQIIRGMCKEQGVVIDDDALEKCRKIFYNACKQSDFGNGRFARNLLDKALLNQAKRIAGTGCRGRVTKRMLTTLIADDFDEDILLESKQKIRRIGFV